MPSYEPTPVVIAKRQLVTRCVTDGRRTGLALAFVDGAAKQLTSELGAVWLAPRRMWIVDAMDHAALQRRLGEVYAHHSGVFDLQGMGATLREGTRQPDLDFFSQVLDVQVFPLQPRGWAVSSCYDKPVIRAMQRLRARFHKFAQAWEVQHPLSDVLAELQETAGIAQDYVFVHERPVVLEDLVAPPKSEAPITVPAASPPTGDGAGKNEQSGTAFLSTLSAPTRLVEVDEQMLSDTAISAGLRDYQVAGVRFLLGRTSCLLGDDMGLGKSRQAVVAGRLAAGSAPENRVLVVCPASLRINWEREIRAVYPSALVGMVGEDRLQTLYGCQWVIANYEKLGGLVRETGLRFSVMMIDECHYLKEHQAGRTRNAFILAERIERRYLITGTPLLNREIELHTLLRLSGHSLGMLQLADFRKKFSGGKDQRALLASELSGWMIRRRKSVLKDLGTKNKQVRYVSPPEGLGAYTAILDDMSMMVMPKIVKLRQTLEALKFDFVLETAQSLGPDDKIIVFAEYMVTVEALKSALSASNITCVSLVGSDPSAKRQKAVDAFQNDPSVKVFIGTTSAAGVGITLTAANYVIFCSMPWTPALMRQAEDRAYRLGQKRDVIVIVPIVPTTIDEQIWQLLDSKTSLEQDVVEAAVAARITA